MLYITWYIYIGIYKFFNQYFQSLVNNLLFIYLGSFISVLYIFVFQKDLSNIKTMGNSMKTMKLMTFLYATLYILAAMRSSRTPNLQGTERKNVHPIVRSKQQSSTDIPQRFHTIQGQDEYLPSPEKLATT